VGVLWITLVFVLGGVPLLFVIVLPIWTRRSVQQGLVRRSRTPVAVRTDAAREAIVVQKGERIEVLRFERISRARHGINGNWTESKLVEDALTLYDATGASVCKIPASALGFDDLVRELKNRGVAIETVDIEAPAFLD
jgi:hypothetical protein